MRPSIQVVSIAASDPALFEHLMNNAGFRLASRDTDPLQDNVQTESVSAVASMISEDRTERVQLSQYQRALKEMAEKIGYIAILDDSKA